MRKKQENIDGWHFRYDRQSCGDFLLHAVQTRPRLKQTNPKNFPTFGLERRPHRLPHRYLARLTCLGRAA